MKRIILAALIMTMGISSGSFAEGMYKSERSSLNNFEDIQPSAGDPSGVMNLSMNQIREIQRALSSKGYNPGAIDGRMGARTESALESFQSSRGLEVTGTATNETLMKLGFGAESENQ